VDQIYTSEVDREARVKVLIQLAALGSNPGGRVYSIICGSSATMPLLITKNLVHDPKWETSFKYEFPLLPHAPNLNGSKYAGSRFATSPKEDLEVLLRAYELQNNKAAKNVLFFCAGANLRAARRILESKEEHQFVGGILRFLQASSSRSALKEFDDLIARLYNELLLRNPWLKSMHVADFTRIGEDLLERFVPLSSVMVESVLISTKHNLTSVEHLINRGFFSGCHSTALYPRTVLDLWVYAQTAGKTDSEFVTNAAKAVWPHFWEWARQIDWASLVK
jgi:hypothetical protein